MMILEWKRRLIFWFGAILVGLVAIFYAIACDRAIDLFHKWIVISPYLPLIITPLGFVSIVFITRRYFPGSQGSGIPQAMASLYQHENTAMREQILSLRIAFGKIILTILGLFFGASVGREGPSVQIGASIMYGLGKFAKFPRHDLEKGLILAGSAAGVAAAFNTPLAGIVFAIEELGRSFEKHNSTTMLMSVIIAGITSLAVQGNYSYFGHTAATLSFGREWGVVIICGLAGGFLGGAFSRILVQINKGISGSIGTLIKSKPATFAAICGLALALIGLLSGDNTYGSGYIEAKSLINGSANLPESYGFLKMMATIVSYISGIPGGIMAPSLSAGAGFGANIAHFYTSMPTAAVVILGMVAYFAGVTQAPITAFVIVMEMIDNHEMILPLMATSLIANACSRTICPKPLYYTLAQSFIKNYSEKGETHREGSQRS